jgi:hypothetical protein
MDETLRLEYVCTSAEIEEAQNLVLRERIGGGSQWLTLCLLLVMLAAILFFLYERIPPLYRPYVFGLARGMPR